MVTHPFFEKVFGMCEPTVCVSRCPCEIQACDVFLLHVLRGTQPSGLMLHLSCYLAIQIATYELLFYSAFESPELTAVMPVLALEVQGFLGSVYVQGPRAVRSRKMHVSDCMAPQPNAAGWCFCKPGLSPAQGVGVHIPTSVLQEGSLKLDSFLRSAISPSRRESVPSSVWQQGVFWRL